MSSPRLRETSLTAYVAPLAVFLLFNALAPLFTIENSQLPWWRNAPEHWIYPLQTFICGGLLLYFRDQYTFKPLRGFLLATVLGVAGIILWFLPSWLFARSGGTTGIPWLGFVSRTGGYDPTIFDPTTTIYWEDVILRFVRLVVVVPFVEEIFWRGFLMRYVIAGDRSFLKVPFGTHHRLSFAVTTLAVVFVHQKEDWAGAFVFGCLMYFLCVRTKSLSACVWMHAVANLILGLYVMKTRQWGFW